MGWFFSPFWTPIHCPTQYFSHVHIVFLSSGLRKRNNDEYFQNIYQEFFTQPTLSDEYFHSIYSLIYFFPRIELDSMLYWEQYCIELPALVSSYSKHPPPSKPFQRTSVYFFTTYSQHLSSQTPPQYLALLWNKMNRAGRHHLLPIYLSIWRYNE